MFAALLCLTFTITRCYAAQSAAKQAPPTTDTYIKQLASFDKLSDDELVSLLAKDNIHTKVVVASLLLTRQDERGLDIIITNLENPDPDIRASAVWALRDVVDPRAKEPLIRLLDDDNAAVTAAATKILGQYKDPSLLDKFCKLALQGKNEQTRAYSADAIGQIGDLKSVPILLKMIKGDDNEAVTAAGRALFALRDPAMVPILIDSLKDSNTDVRNIAFQCLIHFDDPKAEEAINAIKNKLVREDSPGSAYDLPTYVDVETIKSIIRDRQVARFDADKEYFDPPSCGELNLKSAISALQSPDSEARQSAFDTLKMHKSKESVEPLIKLIEQKDPKVQNSVIVLLGYIGNQRACQPLQAKMRQGGWLAITSARALQRLGRYDLVSEAVIKLLDTKDPKVRAGAAVVLGDARDKTALTKLVPMLKDPSPDVHKAVIFALSRIDTPEAAKALVPCLTVTSANDL